MRQASSRILLAEGMVDFTINIPGTLGRARFSRRALWRVCDVGAAGNSHWAPNVRNELTKARGHKIYVKGHTCRNMGTPKERPMGGAASSSDFAAGGELRAPTRGKTVQAVGGICLGIGGKALI